MTLAELCEPLFQYICRLNRSARKGGHMELNAVRGDIKKFFIDMRATASGEPRLGVQFAEVELPLIFFVDSMIAESALSIAEAWNQDRLSYEKDELAGDEKFFELLDKTLADPSETATERLGIYYTCIGLGFTGWYSGQSDDLKKMMRGMAVRLRDRMQFDEQARICPEAYRHLDTRDLIEPPGYKLVGIVIALVGLSFVLLFTNLLLYKRASSDLATSLDTIKSFENQIGKEEASSIDNPL